MFSPKAPVITVIQNARYIKENVGTFQAALYLRGHNFPLSVARNLLLA